VRENHMTYPAGLLTQLTANRSKVVQDLQSLMFEGLRQSEPLTHEEARRHLRHGVGRRLSVMKKSVEQIFVLFPPTQQNPLQHEVLTEVQIYLHAFVINLSGIFDNWAWAFLFRHGLNKAIDKRNVSLFRRRLSDFCQQRCVITFRHRRCRLGMRSISRVIGMHLHIASLCTFRRGNGPRTTRNAIGNSNSRNWNASGKAIGTASMPCGQNRI
jgi:hypothetical protein